MQSVRSNIDWQNSFKWLTDLYLWLVGWAVNYLNTGNKYDTKSAIYNLYYI